MVAPGATTHDFAVVQACESDRA